jgi:hypothetical protein
MNMKSKTTSIEMDQLGILGGQRSEHQLFSIEN